MLLIECLKYANGKKQDYVINLGVKSHDLGTTWNNFDTRMISLSENHKGAKMSLEFNTKFDETRNIQ